LKIWSLGSDKIFKKIPFLFGCRGAVKIAKFVWMGTSGLKLSKFIQIMTTGLKKLPNLFGHPPGYFQMFARRPTSRDQAQ
jgi:hypothetical protein